MLCCMALVGGAALAKTAAPRGSGLAKRGLQAVRDTPYAEMIAHRFTYSGVAPVGQWPAAPFNGTRQLLRISVAAAAEGGTGKAASKPASGTQVTVVVAVDGALYTVAVDEGRAEIRPLVTIGFDPRDLVSLRAAAGSAGGQMALVHSKGVLSVKCALSKGAASGFATSCETVSSSSYDLGAINDVVGLETAGAGVFAIAAANGLYRFAGGSFTALATPKPGPVLSLSFHAPPSDGAGKAGGSVGTLATGSEDVVALYNVPVSDGPAAPQLSRWEWVTRLSDEAGGVYDGPAQRMAFGADGSLYVATPVCVNVRHTNGSVSRLGWREGYPMNSTTSVDVEHETGNILVGSPYGAALWESARGAWRYFYGARYLAGSSVVGPLLAASPTVSVVSTDGGLTVLESQQWTLAMKAEQMEAILKARHDRHGLVGDCSLGSFGNLSSFAGHDDDNNGLWTSLVVGALALKHAVTGDADAKALAEHYHGGMRLLNDITGIKGLMARSAVAPGESHQSGHWHPSTVEKYKGWTWKGDTSSDEVAGHIFANTLMADLLNSSAARSLLTDITTYIVNNGFNLVDVTGNATLWGRWSPVDLNDNRRYSDGRGVNSLQMLAHIRATVTHSGDPTGVLEAGYKTLVNATNQYAQNLLNLKIESPGDDNFSDDELTFLPFLSFCFSANMSSLAAAPFSASLDRTWNAVRALRSDLWNAAYIACEGSGMQQHDVDAIAWFVSFWRGLPVCDACISSASWTGGLSPPPPPSHQPSRPTNPRLL